MQFVLLVLIVLAIWWATQTYGADGVVIGLGMVIGGLACLFGLSMLVGGIRGLLPPRPPKGSVHQIPLPPTERPAAIAMLVTGIVVLSLVWICAWWIWHNLM